ncbi:hypothetical protein EXA23_07905 [Vibrio cincinnatiensis]|uniref:KfrA N-terminal DNA-binding domain-containing protein n=1 Tax=Vibrio cincinnatiensis DSM 19608 TaxID=1123491 RepID=A0A1T4RXF2_VIBCI|nr:hypothetical protein [Vibrio cincinnatiensis]MCG3723335.1 hypothetical protein [Vibrio cincinnatiensis]MCG3725880.1 hypothetical protein [Vibrio cincinnatiensis]MCG3732887.1 hypothetical protein [Vibrio cincinnatiensis]MCG3736853.1 hypothetical protein [Vibrio cincinnatiensis]MCG3740374.1 hypothetical protein [Vibrio cincinnatiensis]
MLTKDVTHELATILAQLQQQGKEPTVALVKARLSSSIPMPAIISAIKSWKNSQRVPKVEIATSKNDDQQRIQELEQTVLALIARVEQLEIALLNKETV